MIKLPKEVVMPLAQELKDLTELKESLKIEELEAFNKDVESKILDLQKQIEDLKSTIKEIPTIDEERLKELTDILIISGYFKLVRTETEEYLEETDEYIEPVVESATPSVESEPVEPKEPVVAISEE